MTRPCEKLYVRILAERSPVDTKLRRSAARSAATFSCSAASIRDFNTFNAAALFLCWEDSSWQVTTNPVGIWVMRMADSVLFTCCPPAPLAR